MVVGDYISFTLFLKLAPDHHGHPLTNNNLHCFEIKPELLRIVDLVD